MFGGGKKKKKKEEDSFEDFFIEEEEEEDEGEDVASASAMTITIAEADYTIENIIKLNHLDIQDLEYSFACGKMVYNGKNFLFTTYICDDDATNHMYAVMQREHGENVVTLERFKFTRFMEKVNDSIMKSAHLMHISMKSTLYAIPVVLYELQPAEILLHPHNDEAEFSLCMYMEVARRHGIYHSNIETVYTSVAWLKPDTKYIKIERGENDLPVIYENIGIPIILNTKYTYVEHEFSIKKDMLRPYYDMTHQITYSALKPYLPKMLDGIDIHQYIVSILDATEFATLGLNTKRIAQILLSYADQDDQKVPYSLTSDIRKDLNLLSYKIVSDSHEMAERKLKDILTKRMTRRIYSRISRFLNALVKRYSEVCQSTLNITTTYFDYIGNSPYDQFYLSKTFLATIQRIRFTEVLL